MDRDQNAASSAQCREREEPKRGRAVQDYDVVVVLEGCEHTCDPREEHAVGAAVALGQNFGRIVLELLQFEIPWNDIEAGKIGFPNDLGQRPTSLIVADCAVQCFVFLKIEFRL